MDIEDIVPVKTYQYKDENVTPFVKDLIDSCGAIGPKHIHDDIEETVKENIEYILRKLKCGISMKKNSYIYLLIQNLNVIL
jgi:hypothetical protein